MVKLWASISVSLYIVFPIIFPCAYAATLTVRPDGQGIFATLQAAIDAAAIGDTVLALPGTFSGPGNRDLDFGGKDLCLLGRDGSDSTTIDCEYLGRGAIFQSGESRDAIIEGFRIIRGGNEDINGGGIRCEEAGPTIRDIWVSGSQAGSCGGFAIVSGSVDITGVIVENNPGSEIGIGLYWADSTCIRNSLVSNNSTGGYGGGINIYESNDVVLENIQLIGNHAGIAGGGVRCRESSVIVIDCLFQGNDAGDGGAISHTGTGLTIQNCIFIGNWVWRWGGALYLDESYGALVENCDFQGNNSAWGGIIQVMNYSDPTLRQLTIVDNNHGSAVDTGCCYTHPTVENCLIAFNQGGYGIEISYTNQLSISCSDVFGNEYGEYGEYPDQTGINGNISENPLFCDPTYATLGIAEESPCLPEHNDCGVLMGNHGAECTLTVVGAPSPPGLRLEANYPNPFNPGTTIPFSLSEPSALTLSIHDASGRRLRVLASGRVFPAGRHSLRWDGLDAAGHPAPSGLYFYRLATARGATARPMLLIK